MERRGKSWPCISRERSRKGMSGYSLRPVTSKQRVECIVSVQMNAIFWYCHGTIWAVQSYYIDALYWQWLLLYRHELYRKRYIYVDTKWHSAWHNTAFIWIQSCIHLDKKWSFDNCAGIQPCRRATSGRPSFPEHNHIIIKQIRFTEQHQLTTGQTSFTKCNYGM